jgi:hypothetical protein
MDMTTSNSTPQQSNTRYATSTIHMNMHHLSNKNKSHQPSPSPSTIITTTTHTDTTTPSSTKNIDLDTNENISSSSSMHHHHHQQSNQDTPCKLDKAILQLVPNPHSDEHKFLLAVILSNESTQNRNTLKNSIVGIPRLNGTHLDLYSLYNAVTKRGGFAKIMSMEEKEQDRMWSEIYHSLDASNQNPAFDLNSYKSQLVSMYKRYLLLYETQKFVPSAATATATVTQVVKNGNVPSPIKSQSPLSVFSNPITSADSSQSTTPKRDIPNLTFRFYLTLNWSTTKKQFIDNKPQHCIDIEFELRDTPLVHAILSKLPILEHCNKFGEQLVYFTCPSVPETPEIQAEEKANCTDIIEYGSLVYWRAGSSLVFGWGRTPAGKNNDCKLLEPCTVIGKWKMKGTVSDYSRTITNTLAPVHHAMTQLQLKRRIERTADKFRDMMYIIVEVQKSDYFRQDNTAAQQTVSLRQILKASPITALPATSPRKTTQPVASSNSSSSSSSSTNGPKTPPAANSRPSVQPDKLPGFILPPSSATQKSSLSQAKQLLDSKKKKLDMAKSNNKQTTDVEPPPPRKQVVVAPPPPSKANGTTQHSAQQPPQNGEVKRLPPTSNQQLQLLRASAIPFPILSPNLAKQISQQNGSAAGKRRAGEELERPNKRPRLARKLPDVHPLPDCLTEIKSVENNTDTCFQIIIKYKYNGESDGDSRLLRRLLKFSPPQIASSSSSNQQLSNCSITGGNIVSLLESDNVLLQGVDEIRLFEQGIDEDTSGWVLLTNNFEKTLKPDTTTTTSTTKVHFKLLLR